MIIDVPRRIPSDTSPSETRLRSDGYQGAPSNTAESGRRTQDFGKILRPIFLAAAAALISYMPILWTEAQFPVLPEIGVLDPALAGHALLAAITRVFAPAPVPAGNHGWRSVPDLRPVEGGRHERP